MIAFFEVLASLVDSVIAVNFVSRANGKKFFAPKILIFAVVYFVVNLICVFAGVEFIYIAAFDLVILLCLSLTTSSYKSFKAYVSPICVIGIIVFVTVFYIVFFGFVFFYKIIFQ